ncbi:MAG: 50S ribosomal protein L19 [Candidatus Nealsonbacteria bacterium]|nr:50S ribosomal protein L19 [Candidatus Nealsonbacteria bacterium]
METKKFNEVYLKKDLPDIRPGDTVKVYQKLKETPKKGKSSAEREDRERIQVFEGVVIARKHGKGISATIAVRAIISGVGVERVFPLHSPIIEKIEIVKRGRVRRAKLYYLRKIGRKKTKIKDSERKYSKIKKIIDTENKVKQGRVEELADSQL